MKVRFFVYEVRPLKLMTDLNPRPVSWPGTNWSRSLCGRPSLILVLQQSIQKCSIFLVTQTQIVTRCILYQIKGMNLRNMNIGDANAVKLDKIDELTLSVPW